MKEERDLINRLASGRLSRREFIRLSLAAGLSVPTIAAALAACAPAETPAPTPATGAGGKVTVAPGSVLTLKLRAAFIPEVNDILAAQVNVWGAKNGVPVQVDIVSLNELQTIAASVAETGAGPDLIELSQNSPYLFAEQLVDVSDVADDLGSRFGGWYPVGEEACNVDGRWLAVPRFFAPHAIVYRRDNFETVGYKESPKTWDEMLDLGRKLKAAQLPPLGFPLGHAVSDGNDFAYSILWSFGGKEVEADGKTVAINSRETAAAIDFMRQFFQEAMIPDVLSWDDASNNRVYSASEISATNDTASLWATLKNIALNIYKATNHSQYPAGPAGKVTYAEVTSQAVLSRSPNVDAAKALIQYLNEKEQLAPWAQAGSSFTYPLLRAYEDMVIMPWNMQAEQAAFKGIAGTAHLPGYPSRTSGLQAAESYTQWIVVDMFANACAGMSTQDAMTQAESQLRQIYQ